MIRVLYLKISIVILLVGFWFFFRLCCSARKILLSEFKLRGNIPAQGLKQEKKKRRGEKDLLTASILVFVIVL